MAKRRDEKKRGRGFTSGRSPLHLGMSLETYPRRHDWIWMLAAVPPLAGSLFTLALFVQMVAG